jgi:citrate synthase
MTEFRTAVSEATAGRVLIRGYSHEEIIGRLPYAEATWLTLVGDVPSPAQARLVDAILTSLLDHGFVASTVSAARFVASGNPQLIPAVAAGLLAAGQNTLSPQHAFELIGHARRLRAERGLSVDAAARAVVEELLASGRRVPGFGHPIHRGGDFRATALFALADDLGLAGEATSLYRATHRAFVDITGKTGVPINIDGCLACLGMDLGLSADQTVALALLAVLPGLMAHVIEEIETGKPLRYIRDGAYTGEPERSLPEPDRTPGGKA